MKEVSKDEFYRVIGPQDVVVSVQGNFPYTTEFQTKSRTVKGIVVDSYGEVKKYPIITKYYLPKQ